MEDPVAPKTILVVDDEDGVRESVREVLSDEGYRVLDTSDGAQVLKIIRDERPELVLLDIWMPQMDGIAATRGDSPATSTDPDYCPYELPR